MKSLIESMTEALILSAKIELEIKVAILNTEQKTINEEGTPVLTQEFDEVLFKQIECRKLLKHLRSELISFVKSE